MDTTTFVLIYNDMLGDLVITEINYNDPGQYDNVEFIEIFNNGSTALPLGGLSFSSGVDYAFPEFSLPVGDYYVIAKPAYSGWSGGCDTLPYGCGFQNVFGIAPDGEFQSNSSLSNTGETIEIINSIGGVVDIVTYSDSWLGGVTDGTGPSLSLCNVSGDNNLEASWLAATTSVTQACGTCPSTLVNATGTFLANPWSADAGCSLGCTDLSADNYDPLATLDDGSCTYTILGCTDPAACNYDPLATIDDGSCISTTPTSHVINAGMYYYVPTNLTINVGDTVTWINDAGYHDVNGDVNSLTGVSYNNPESFYLPPTSGPSTIGSYVFTVAGSYTYDCSIGSHAANGMIGFIDVNSIPLGCTDLTATNFDPSALCDDGSCTYDVFGCTDPTATNYDPLATQDDGSCTYPPAAMVNLFFSEYAEGSSNNKYLEIYNPSLVTVDLSDYAYANVSNDPSTPGVYEYWNDFDAGASIAPGDVYVIAHPSADPAILAVADETHSYLSNGDDGYALVYGSNPGSPVDPATGGYIILDFIGDWNGDPGSGWSVAGVSDATKDHTLVRKCDVTQGNDDWVASAGTNTTDSEWEVLPQNDWSNLHSHTTPCASVSGCTDPTATNYDPSATVDDGSCIYTDCAGIVNGTALVDACGVCHQAYIYNFITHVATFVDNANLLIAGVDYNPAQELVVFPGDSGDPYWNSSCSGCTDSTATNYDPSAIVDDGSCTYSSVLGCTDPTATNYDPLATQDDGSCTYPPAAMVNLFFSEYAEGSSNNKYLEIYNPSLVTVDLSDYAYANVSNDPSTPGVYEYWNDFDAGASIAPGDVYVIAHPSADPAILAVADAKETHSYLSNGDDGYALVYGSNPGSPVDPATGGYIILDFIGDWNGDPGSGWSVAGVSDATKDHTLVRKCDVTQGNDDWVASAGTNTTDSEWEVLPQNDWSNLHSHTTPCASVSGCTDPTATNYDPSATVDDGTCLYVTDCAGIVNGTALVDSCGVCHQAYLYTFATYTVTFVDNANLLIAGVDYNPATQLLVIPGDAGDPYWNSSCSGCTDPTATNYDPTATVDDGTCSYTFVCDDGDPCTIDTWNAATGLCEFTYVGDGCTDPTATNYDPAATCDDGSCTYPAPMVNLFFSEYAEGSSNNKYLEIYNPSLVTVDLSDYAYANVSNDPSTPGVYEYWNDFDAGASIAPGDVYVIAHPSADPAILAVADETHSYLSNGDDGYALVYGSNPGSPVDPATGGYIILDFIGDWNGDPGSGWSVAGVSDATKDHTLVRKCDVTQGNDDWVASAGTNTTDSEWEVLPQNDWSNLHSHTTPCASVSGCTDPAACNYDASANVDDGSCDLPNGCDDPLFLEYDPSVTCADATACLTLVVNGCTDPAACNYDASANVDDGSCLTTYGCTDPTQFNYDPAATCDDGSCVPFTGGCTDSAAANYNPSANTDDGSCLYPWMY